MTAVIGAGIAGLTAAIELALAGEAVHVFESQAAAGGKAAPIRKDGFTFDPGPSIVILPRIYNELLRRAGEDPAKWIRFERLDPFTRLFPEGEDPIDLPAEPEALFEAAYKYFPKDAAALRASVEALKPLAPIGEDIFFRRTVQSAWDLLDPRLLKFGKALDVRHPFKEQADRQFQSSVLRALFYGFPSYSGLTYHSKSAAAWFIPYYMICEGVYYPKRGIHKIPEALAGVAEKLGVIFHYQAKVTGVEAAASRIQALTVSGCESVRADSIVCGVDRAMFEALLGRQEGRPPALSYSTVQIGVKAKFPMLGCHNLFIENDYESGFKSLYDDESSPNWKVTYAHMPEAVDSSLSPEGSSQLFLAASSPADNGRVDWKQETDGWRERLLPKLRRFGLEVKESDIQTEVCQTPLTFAERDGNYKGSLFGLREENRGFLGVPPGNKDPQYKNLFYCGATVQPGAGMPMACLSGTAASRLLLKAREKSFR